MITTGTPLVVNSDGTVREAIGDEEIPFGYALEPAENGIVQMRVKNSSMLIKIPEHCSWKTIEEEQGRESFDFPDNDDYSIFAGEI